MKFCDNLKTLRRDANLTQLELAEKLGIKKSTISMYENGNREPNFETLELIADFFNIDMDRLCGRKPLYGGRSSIYGSTQLEDLITTYNQLNDLGKNEAHKRVKELTQINKYRIQETSTYVIKPLYQNEVSAGVGMIVDTQEVSTIKLCSGYEANQADYVLLVRGDSMEPTYSDGDLVLVRAQSKIDVGEIGIFILEDEGFIKELGDNQLISHNKNYDPITLTQYDNVHCCGLVLGKATVKK